MFQFFNCVFDFGGAVGTVQIFQYKGLFMVISAIISIIV